MSVARADGYSVLIVAGLGAVFTAAGGSFVPTVAACLAAGCGAMEIHGAQQLARGDERAVNWLVRAQLLLMMVILGYALWQLTHFDEAFARSLIPEFRRSMAGLSLKWKMDNPYDYLSDSQLVLMARLGNTVVYCAVGIATCVYQGLMARYYHRRRAAVAQALAG